MNNWYLLSLIALVLLGVQRFLYKVAAEKGCRSALTTACFMATVTVVSATIYFAGSAPERDPSALLILALLNSSFFALATISHIEALRHLPAGVTFPLTRLSLAGVLLVSLLFFGERLQPLHWLGLLLGALAVVLLSREAHLETRPGGNLRRGFLFIASSILCAVVATVASKLAAESVSKSGFIALSYLLGSGFSLIIEKTWKKTERPGNLPAEILIGCAMGVLNFLGFYAFLAALEKGPLALVALISGMHFVIAVILSALIYREKLTWYRGVGILLILLMVYFLSR